MSNTLAPAMEKINGVKYYLPANKKVHAAIMITLGLWLAFLIIFFTIRGRKTNREVEAIKRKEISGRIEKLKDLTRGSYDIQIRSGSQIATYYFQNLGQYVDKIDLGDSIYKAPNTLDIRLFKHLTDGIYTDSIFLALD